MKKKFNFFDFYFYYLKLILPRFFQIKNPKIINLFKKKTIEFMVHIVGQKCNLKCKDCCNFTPLMPQIFYSYENQINNLKKISQCVNIELLQIQGGEPLLWDKLEDFLKDILAMNFVKNIQIATNGTKKPSPSFIKFLKLHNQITIRISPYPGVSDRQGNKLYEELTLERINVGKHPFANASGDWSYLGGPDFKELSPKEGIYNFNNCVFRKCLTLEDGILARCSRGPTAHQVQKFEPYKNDLFSFKKIFKNEYEFTKKFLGYVFNPQPMRACNFCNGTNGEPIVAGKQFRKKEWEESFKAVNFLKIKS